MPIPSNLAEFVPKAKVEPTAEPKTPVAPQPSEGDGLVSSIVSKLKSAAGSIGNAVGGLFGSKKPAPQAQNGIPENLQEFVQKSPDGKVKATPPPPSTSKIPSNLQEFVVPQKKNISLDTSKPDLSGKANPLGDLFSSPKTESSTSATDEFVPGRDVKLSDFVTSLPKAVADTVLNVGKGLNKTVAELAISLGQAAIAHTKYGPDMASGFTPSTQLDKDLFGEGDVKGLSFQVADLEQEIKNSDFAKSIGVDKYALPLAFGGIVGGETLNFVPGGEGEDAIVGDLVKAKTAEEAATILRRTGITEDLVQDVAPKFAEMTDKKQVRDALGIVGHLHSAIMAKDTLGEINSGELDKLLAKEAEFTEKTKQGTEGETGSVEPQTTDENGLVKSDIQGGREVGTAKLGDTDLSIKKGGVIEGLPAKAEIIHPGETPITETTPAEVIHPGDVPQPAPQTPEVPIERKIADTKDPTEITKILETTGVTPTEIPAMAKQLAGVDSPAKVHSIIEGFDIPERKTTPLPPALEQKQLEIQSKEQVLENSPFKNADNRSLVDNEGRVRELGNTQGNLSRKIEDMMAKAGVSDPAEFSTGVEKYLQDKKALTETKKLFNEEKKKYFESIRPPKRQAPPEVEGAKTWQTISELLNGKASAEPPTPPKPDFSVGTQGIAVTPDDTIKSGPFKEIHPETVKQFQSFVNNRKYDTLSAFGVILRKMVEPLREMGIDGILRLEGYEIAPNGEAVPMAGGPDLSGMLKTYRTIDNGLYAEAKRLGVPLPYRENHVRIYAIKTDTGEIIDGETGLPLTMDIAPNGRRVAKRPGFSQPRTFKNNAEVLNTPGYDIAYKNLPDILYHSAMEFQRAFANQRFLNYVMSTGNAVPESLVDKSVRPYFSAYDTERFPKRTIQIDDKRLTEPLWGPKPIVQKVNQYLRDPNFPTLQKAGKFFGSLKNIALSVGIPKTGLTVHYWNMIPREVISDIALAQNPKEVVSEIGKFLYYGINSAGARTYIDSNMEKAFPYLQAGMTFSSEEHALAPLDLTDKTVMQKTGSMAEYVGNMLHDAFAKNVFSRIIPARKLYQAQRIKSYLVTKGASEEDAVSLAAHAVNNLYGGINWEELGRSKDWQNLMRTVLIAPDFAESNYNIGKGMAKGLGRLFKTPKEEKPLLEGGTITPGSVESKIYRNFAYAFIGLYIAANAINYEKSGKLMVQNDPLHQLSIAWGKDNNGKTRYINAFGTGADFFRIPAQVVGSITQQKYKDLMAIFRNRLSIPVGSAVSLLSNTDWSGQNIFGPDIFGNPQSTAKQLQNVFNNTIGNVAPSSITSLENVITGKTSPEQALIQGAGFPIGYVNEKPNATTIKALEQKAKDGIAKGDYTLYNQLVKTKVIAPRSRSAFIRSAITGAKTARQIKTSAKAKANLQEKEANLEAAGFNKNSN